MRPAETTGIPLPARRQFSALRPNGNRCTQGVSSLPARCAARWALRPAETPGFFQFFQPRSRAGERASSGATGWESERARLYARGRGRESRGRRVHGGETEFGATPTRARVGQVFRDFRDGRGRVGARVIGCLAAGAPGGTTHRARALAFADLADPRAARAHVTGCVSARGQRWPAPRSRGGARHRVRHRGNRLQTGLYARARVAGPRATRGAGAATGDAGRAPTRAGAIWWSTGARRCDVTDRHRGRARGPQTSAEFLAGEGARHGVRRRVSHDEPHRRGRTRARTSWSAPRRIGRNRAHNPRALAREVRPGRAPADAHDTRARGRDRQCPPGA